MVKVLMKFYIQLILRDKTSYLWRWSKVILQYFQEDSFIEAMKIRQISQDMHILGIWETRQQNGLLKTGCKEKSFQDSQFLIFNESRMMIYFHFYVKLFRSKIKIMINFIKNQNVIIFAFHSVFITNSISSLILLSFLRAYSYFSWYCSFYLFSKIH